MNKFYLDPVDGRKSFNNKCYVEANEKQAVLYSYNTKICTYVFATGSLIKTKDFNFSATTKRHQKAFFNFYNIPEV